MGDKSILRAVERRLKQTMTWYNVHNSDQDIRYSIMRIPVIAANWKMHKTREEARDFAQELAKKVIPQDREVILGVGATLLEVVSAEISGKIGVAAQNVHTEEEGAFTGEISLKQAKNAGATHVIVGHSERRHLFGETDEMVNKKLKLAEKEGSIAILCVGEVLEDREAGKEKEVVKNQIVLALAGLETSFIEKVIVAYEPVWAIGSGEVATPEQAEEMHELIRTLIPEATRVIYGGSVKPENCEELIEKPFIDGFLVGGASLDIDTFYAIVNVGK